MTHTLDSYGEAISTTFDQIVTHPLGYVDVTFADLYGILII